MAKKIDVIGISGVKEAAQIKKCVAEQLVRRLFAEWVVKGSCIRRLAIKAVSLCAPRFTPKSKPYVPKTYEHHIEPRLEKLTTANSEWLQYLHGWQTAAT